MTSSLVGSEMCIRDRKKTWHNKPYSNIKRTAERGGGQDARRAGGTPRTVSYTHLTLPTICSV
eukprot:2421812-Prorocentrum_lima.AAC.1